MSNAMSIDQRMKEYYEFIPKTKLMRRTPVAIRIDGKAFHTFTKGFKKPFDDIMVNCMEETMMYLCKNIQGCVFGYTQSDEITLILIDYQKLTSDAWFDYEVQKICSIAASMATLQFNRSFKEWTQIVYKDMCTYKQLGEDYYNYVEALSKSTISGAMFDARCFNIPKEEVCNLILWRQQDAIKNSIQGLGRANFSHNQLHGKNGEQIKEMLSSKGVNWDDLPIHLQQGSACYKKGTDWYVDECMPILKGESRHYINDLIFVGEE